MTDYAPPYRDIEFSLIELNGYEAHLDGLEYPGDSSIEDVTTLLGEFGRFCQNVLHPLNQSGDREGVRLEGDRVLAPEGFKEAYDQYVESGWPRMSYPDAWGGIPMPYSARLALNEIMWSANHGWTMFVSQNDGSIKILESYASQSLIDAYVPPLVSGEWLATMCLTEPQCGSDLNLVRTVAVPTEEGSYRIRGNKAFVTGGEHEFTDNIVHLVLARLPDAPEGTRGISLFLVPKRKLNVDGSSGERNGVECISVEHKMGLKGSATCSMAFDDAEGWLIGEPNRGLNYMFLLINKSRLGVAQHAIGHIEASHQASLEYACERLTGRAPRGKVCPDKAADPLVYQPDIRRMLMSQKAIAEAGRALVHWCGKYVDLIDYGTPEQRKDAEQYLGLLTPIAKGCLSELGSEVVDYGIQVLGGHGYVNDHSLEQHVRDVRVTRIYEGTSYIQAADLLQRKILGHSDAMFERFLADLTVPSAVKSERLKPLQLKLEEAVRTLKSSTEDIAKRSVEDPSLVPSIALDYLMVVGYVTFASLWLSTALKAEQKLAEEGSDRNMYLSKLETAKFYFAKLLPRVATHYAMIESGSESLECETALGLPI